MIVLGMDFMLILLPEKKIDRLHLLPNIRTQHNYIFTYNTTKHFTSYSDVDAAKGKRIG